MSSDVEQRPEIHITRLAFCVALAGIAYVLGQFIWSWLAVALWVVIGVYALMVADGIVAALRASR